jgi:hypothetical protein
MLATLPAVRRHWVLIEIIYTTIGTEKRYLLYCLGISFEIYILKFICILGMLVIINMILIGECVEIQSNIAVPVIQTACNRFRTNLYPLLPRSHNSNFTKICQMTQNMYVNFQACSLLTQGNKWCCNLGG